MNKRLRKESLRKFNTHLTGVLGGKRRGEVEILKKTIAKNFSELMKSRNSLRKSNKIPDAK
jgi:hypothetical protein